MTVADEINTAGGQPEQTAPAPESTQTASPVQDPKAAQAPTLAETIRQARVEREGKAKASAEAADLRRALDEAKAELARAKSSDDPLADPAGWAKARKLSPADQAAFGQALLYDLVPDKAPPDFRVKLLEAKMAREAKAREEADATKRAEAETSQAKRALADYETTLHVASRSFKTGSHPESEAWFGEDADTYARSLLATARNLAEVARQKGEVANLDPGHVAGVLEQEIARRLTARDARRAGASKSAESAAPVVATGEGGRQAAEGSTLSTKGLGSGGPRPKAVTDRERVQRAIQAAFPAR